MKKVEIRRRRCTKAWKKRAKVERSETEMKKKWKSE